MSNSHYVTDKYMYLQFCELLLINTVVSNCFKLVLVNAIAIQCHYGLAQLHTCILAFNKDDLYLKF